MKHLVSARSREETQQTSGGSQPLFEERYTHRHDQSAAKTDTLTFAGDMQNYTE